MSKYLIYRLDKTNLNDMNYIANNINTLFVISWDKTQFLNQINSSSTITYVLKNIDEIIGFIVLNICLDEIEVLNICINKNYTNKGLGNYLLENVINILKKQDFSKIFLEVNVNNIFAIKLYQKNDFKIISQRKDYYLNKQTNTKEDAYVMTKNL